MPRQSLQKRKNENWKNKTGNISDLPLTRVWSGDLLKEERPCLTPQEVVDNAEAMVGDVLEKDHGQLDHILLHQGLPVHLGLPKGQGFVCLQDFAYLQDFFMLMASTSHLNVVVGVVGVFGEPFADYRSLAWTLLDFQLVASPPYVRFPSSAFTTWCNPNALECGRRLASPPVPSFRHVTFAAARLDWIPKVECLWEVRIFHPS